MQTIEINFFLSIISFSCTFFLANEPRMKLYVFRQFIQED